MPEGLFRRADAEASTVANDERAARAEKACQHPGIFVGPDGVCKSCGQQALNERAAVPDGWLAIRGAPHALRRHDVIAALAARGLRVVTEADMRVLEAMRELPDYVVRGRAERDEPEYVAELARREGEG